MAASPPIAATANGEEAMSKSEPEITVTCNGYCGDATVVGLTALARGAYDERHVDAELKRRGWVSDGDKDYCGGCAEERGLTW